jgi:uncharacterized peroxidase-related enzyme
MTAHGAALRTLTGDPRLVEELKSNYRHARITDRERRMLDYVLKVTRDSQACAEEDVEALRQDGWSDEEIMDITEVTAMFNFTNRVANALGWVPNEEYHSLGR